MQTRDSDVSILLKQRGYKYFSLATEDIMVCIAYYPQLNPHWDIKKKLICLGGTLPVRYRRNEYHFPLRIELNQSHPILRPECYIVPTNEMAIHPTHKHVDLRGFVYLQYLSGWNKATGSNLKTLCDEMSKIFSKHPPVYRKVKVSRIRRLKPRFDRKKDPNKTRNLNEQPQNFDMNQGPTYVMPKLSHTNTNIGPQGGNVGGSVYSVHPPKPNQMYRISGNYDPSIHYPQHPPPPHHHHKLPHPHHPPHPIHPHPHHPSPPHHHHFQPADGVQYPTIPSLNNSNIVKKKKSKMKLNNNQQQPNYNTYVGETHNYDAPTPPTNFNSSSHNNEFFFDHTLSSSSSPTVIQQHPQQQPSEEDSEEEEEEMELSTETEKKDILDKINSLKTLSPRQQLVRKIIDQIFDFDNDLRNIQKGFFFERKWNWIHLAVIFNRFHLLRYLVEKARIDINLRTKDGFENTSLHLACKYGCDVLTIQYLLDHGSVVTSKNLFGQKPEDLVVDSNSQTTLLFRNYHQRQKELEEMLKEVEDEEFEVNTKSSGNNMDRLFDQQEQQPTSHEANIVRDVPGIPFIEKKKEEEGGGDGSQKKKKRILENLENMFTCPITQELMEDPVILEESNQTYERCAIEEWLKKNDTDPLTRIQLKSKKVRPNLILRNAIEEWKKFEEEM